MTEDETGVLYTIWQTDETAASVSPEDESLVDRAMKLWAERRIDTWLSLHQPSGAEFSVLASTITSAAKSDPANRAEAMMRDKAIQDERKANRANAGFIEEEE